MTLGDRTLGCFRIFVPKYAPEVIELGSVVSQVRGTGRIIVSYAEKLAQERNKSILAITGPKYDSTFEKQGWKSVLHEYKNRMQNPPFDKKCWKYSDS